MKQIHELAKFFPPMEGDEFEALCKDVKAHGLLNPIVTKDDKILDGRNRARACEKVGVKPKYEEFKNGNPFEYVVSQNVLRRHLTSSQRAILALELEKMFAKELAAKKGGRPIGGATGGDKTSDTKVRSRYSHDPKAPDTAASKAAAALHIGSATVKYAKRLAKDAPKFIPAVRAGKLSVKEALIQARDERVKVNMERDKVRAIARRREREVRQVADYLDAAKTYVVALKVATAADAHCFSPEAVRFVRRRHDEIRKLMSEFEGALKK